MATRLYYCKDCEGAGSTWSSPSGCANDPGIVDFHCFTCDGDGKVERAADEADLEGLTPYSPSKRLELRDRLRIRYSCQPMNTDPLVILARHRNTGIRGRSIAYADAKRRAMKPAKLRQRIRSTEEFMADVVNPILYRYTTGGAA